MTLEQLSEGLLKVKHPDRETPFMLSVVKVYGVSGVKGYEIGARRPPRGKHLMPTADVRSWLNELELL